MGRKKIAEQPIAFVLVVGDVREDEGVVVRVGSKEHEIPLSQRTMYAIGFDQRTGRVEAVPFSGDVCDCGDVPVLQSTVDREEFNELVDSYGGDARSPRVKSSRRVPNENVTQDFTDGDEKARLEAQLEQQMGKMNNAGYSSVELHLIVIFGIVQKLNEIDPEWKPVGPHTFEKQNDTGKEIPF